MENVIATLIIFLLSLLLSKKKKSSTNSKANLKQNKFSLENLQNKIEKLAVEGRGRKPQKAPRPRPLKESLNEEKKEKKAESLKKDKIKEPKPKPFAYKPKGASVKRKINLKKAIIYSEIMNRKYF